MTFCAASSCSRRISVPFSRISRDELRRREMLYASLLSAAVVSCSPGIGPPAPPSAPNRLDSDSSSTRLHERNTSPVNPPNIPLIKLQGVSGGISRARSRSYRHSARTQDYRLAADVSTQNVAEAIKLHKIKQQIRRSGPPGCDLFASNFPH